MFEGLRTVIDLVDDVAKAKGAAKRLGGRRRVDHLESIAKRAE